MDQPDGIESVEDSHAQMESSVGEASPQMQTISEEYFDEVYSRANELLQTIESPDTAEDLQRLLMVCQLLKRSRLTERMKNEELMGELQVLGEQVMQSVKVTEEDKVNIHKLKTEIDRAWRERDMAHSREEEAHKQMVVMRERMEELQRETDKYAAPKNEDQTSAGVRQRENAIRERDRLTNEVDELNNRLLLMKEYADELEETKNQFEAKNKELYKLLDETSSESFKDKRLLESLRAELQEITGDRDQKLDELSHFRSKSEASHKSSMQHNLQIAALKSNIERLSTQNTVQSMKLSKLTGEHENLSHVKEKLLHDLGVKSNILKLKEDENNKFRLETSKLVKSKELLTKKFLALEMAKTALDQEVTKLKGILLNMEKEQDASRKTFDRTKNQIDNITRERDLVRKELQKVTKLNDDIHEQNILHEQQIRNLENELKQCSASLQRQREVIKKLERDRDRMGDDNQQLMERIEKCREESQMKSAQILDIKATVQDQINANNSLRQQIEVLRTDKITLQREIQLMEKGLEESKNNLRSLGRQMEQMKKIIDSKDLEILRQNKHIEKVEKEKQLILKDVQSLQVQLQHTRSEMKEKQMDCDRLTKSINESEDRSRALEKQLEGSNNQRDVLNVKLMEHAAEIAQLNEKLTNAQSALNRSEVQYANRLDDIRLLKIEISNLRSQSNTISRGLANTTDMRQEVLQLNRSLTQERIKIKALEQEMTTPMNVHRWRELQGKDPDKMELIDKVQTLQKRILKQNTESTKQGGAVNVAQEAVVRMKQFAMKTNSDQQQRLNATQRALSAQTKKWKSAIAELKTREMDLKTKSSTVEDLKQSLVETRKELAKERREKLRLLELRTSMSAGGVNGMRGLGGGSQVTRALVSAVGPRKFN